MSRVYRSTPRPPRPVGRILKLTLSALVVIPLLGAGAIAALHLSGADDPHPLVRLIVVEGNSMLPTFHPGEQLLFVRGRWGPGSVVLADVGEDRAVVKRVWEVQGDRVIITGDNNKTTASYRLPRERIIARFCCRTGLKLSPPEPTAPRAAD
jgi:hypothetical protein